MYSKYIGFHIRNIESVITQQYKEAVINFHTKEIVD
jgi:hypothetical protein